MLKIPPTNYKGVYALYRQRQIQNLQWSTSYQDKVLHLFIISSYKTSLQGSHRRSFIVRQETVSTLSWGLARSLYQIQKLVCDIQGVYTFPGLEGCCKFYSNGFLLSILLNIMFHALVGRFQLELF